MKLSRHARNRLRLIRRRHPELTTGRLLEAVLRGETVGYDEVGNRLVSVSIPGTRLTVVLDHRERIVVTVWEE